MCTLTFVDRVAVTLIHTLIRRYLLCLIIDEYVITQDHPAATIFIHFVIVVIVTLIVADASIILFVLYVYIIN